MFNFLNCFFIGRIFNAFRPKLKLKRFLKIPISELKNEWDISGRALRNCVNTGLPQFAAHCYIEAVKYLNFTIVPLIRGQKN